ncbi:MAG TPA: hypothetical protein VND68_00380, partial [Chloroflexia bacterium]|nr:hypothetical protein [Chloroflexia bacterium]
VMERAEAWRDMSHRERVSRLAALLVREHGLPVGVAGKYANGLLHSNGNGPGFRDWLSGEG